MSTAYTYLWEFIVEPSRLKANGYIDTLLLQDRADPHRFITVDRWKSIEAHRAFRSAFSREYAALDAWCEHLTVRETPLGEFR